MTNTYTDTKKQLIINDITDVDISTVTFNADELYLTPDNAVYSVNNVKPVNGNVTLDAANKDLSNLSTTGNAKFQAPITGGASTITSSNLTANRALISNSSGKVAVSAVTSSQLGYLSTVTSNVQSQLDGKQPSLVSGTNIKTINSTSLLGGGNIDTSEIFVAEYGVTTYAEVLAAYNAGKQIFSKDTSGYMYNFYSYSQVFEQFVFTACYTGSTQTVLRTMYCKNTGGWSEDYTDIADNDLSNLSEFGELVLDGQWTYVNQEICQGRTSETSDKSWTLSLPSDSCNYEVLLTGAVTTGTTSGNQTRIGLQSTIITTNIVMCNAQTRTSSSVTSYGACILPVGSNHKLTVSGWANNTGAYSLWLRGYRRIGRNS